MIAAQRTPATRRSAQRLTYRQTIALVTIFGALLRVVLIGRQPLWRDEAFTALAAQRSMGDMLNVVAHDSAPPLHYVIQNVVTHLLGPQPWALRLVSLLAGAALIPVVAALGRRAGGDEAGLWAGVICAIAPPMLLSSLDARMYAVATLAVTLAALTLWRFVEQPRAHRLLTYAGVAALGLQTDYFVAVALAALLTACVWHLGAPRAVVAGVIAADIVAVAALLPWLLYAQAQFHHAQTGFWVKPLSLVSLGGTALQFFTGPPALTGSGWDRPLHLAQAGAVIAGATALGAGLRARVANSGRGYLLAGGLGAPVLLALVSLWHPILDARYASIGWALILVIGGLGVRALTRWRRLVLAALACSAVTLAALPTHPDTAAVVAYLDTYPQTPVASSASQYLLLQYYGTPQLRQRVHVVAHTVPWFWGTAVFPAGAVVPTFTDLAATSSFFEVDDLGAPPPRVPDGFHMTTQRCLMTTCIASVVRN